MPPSYLLPNRESGYAACAMMLNQRIHVFDESALPGAKQIWRNWTPLAFFSFSYSLPVGFDYNEKSVTLMLKFDSTP
jgi:hypothetical protein